MVLNLVSDFGASLVRGEALASGFRMQENAVLDITCSWGPALRTRKMFVPRSRLYASAGFN